jgi:outer membrane immunogenic protein
LINRAIAAAVLMLSSSIGGTAMAADLSVAPMYGAAPITPASGWSGFYVGGHFGGGWGNFDTTRVTPGSLAFPAGFASSGKVGGPLAGGQIGLDYQLGQAVFGVTASGDWANLTGRTVDSGVVAGLDRNTRDSTLSRMTDVGGRIGFTAWNALLPYVKGGAAWARFDETTTNVSTAGALVAAANGAETRNGWFVGGGLEFRFIPTASMFLEYDHYDFGTATVTRSITAANAATTAAGFGPGVPIQSSNRLDTDVVKVGLNWRPAWTWFPTK